MRRFLVSAALGATIGATVAGPAAAAPRGGCPGLQTEQEPNDTAAGASPIALWGPGELFTAIYGTIAVPGDTDWYTFTAPPGARPWLSVNTGVAGPSGSRDSVVAVFASDGITVIEEDDDDGTGNGWDATIESLDASLVAGPVLTAGGTYFARVRAKDPGATIDGYSVVIAVTTAPPVPETEPTPPCSFMGIGQPLIAGTLSSAADVDCYNVSILDHGIAFMVVDGDPERDGIGTDITLTFKSPGGQTILLTDSSRAGDASNPPAEGFAILELGEVHVTGTGPGTYVIGVWWSTDTCPVPVQLQGFEVE